MNAEQIIADIQRLEHLFSLPDKRAIQTADWKVEQQEDEDDEKFVYLFVSNSWPWLRLRLRDDTP